MLANNRKVGQLIAALAFVLGATTAVACENHRFGFSHGAAFHSIRAAVGGDILVYAQSPRDLTARALRMAGHKVMVVNTEAKLDTALNERLYDVVIVPMDSADRVSSQLSDSSESVLIPVVADSAARLAATAKYSASLSTQSGSREIIQLVNGIVARQSPLS